MRPNAQMSLPGIGIPIDPWSGQPIPPVVHQRLARLKEAAAAFRLALHEMDGTSPGTRPGDRRMAQAFTNLDQAVLWAAAAILDHGDEYG